MPPRLSLRPLTWQCTSCLSQSKANFSSTAPIQALRNIPSPTSNLLALDSDSPDTSNPTESVRSLLAASDSRNRRRSGEGGGGGASSARQSMLERARQKKASDDYMRMQSRRWRVGDVYAPRDFSPVEMQKWRVPRKPQEDVLDILGVNPLDEYKNFSIISEFMTPMGRIKHSSETGLRPVNQRKVAKAIRRAVGLGIHPSVHRHPMILMSQVQNMPRQQSAGMQGIDASKKRRIM